MSDIDALREDERRASGEPKRPDLVTISTAQHEALLAAAKWLAGEHGGNYADRCAACQIIADVRAAGIDLGA